MAGRVRHPIDTKALEAYLAKNLPEIKAPLEVKQFGYGQSNPTYQLTSSEGIRYVLRKKPPGKLVSKTAHKVEREYRIIAALAKTDVPVPRALCLCEDSSVIGTPFYVMSFLDGRIIEDPAIPDVTPAERKAMWLDAVRTLARLHQVDYKSVGLEGFGKCNDFYNRQVKTWKSICEAQAATKDVETGEPVGQLPQFDELMEFFVDQRRQPADKGTVIHGDYKIDNLVFHKTEPRVIGILDWEMSTIGNPLSDLSNFLTPFYTANQDPKTTVSAHPGFRPGATPGLPQSGEITSLYFSIVSSASSAQTKERELQWAQAFNILRQAAICQGIAARQAARQASSEKAARYATGRDPLARFAWELVKDLKKLEAEKPRL